MASLPILGTCGPDRTGYPEAFHSPRVEQRIQAIRQAARTGDKDVIPLLIDRLDDEDAAVRLYAILALEKLTGTRRGYRYEADENERNRAVQRWRRWAARQAATAPEATQCGS